MLALSIVRAAFGGHSLRAGFLTSAAAKGASIFKMMDTSRHKSVDTLRLRSGRGAVPRPCGRGAAVALARLAQCPKLPDQNDAAQRLVAMCQLRHFAPQQIGALFYDLVGAAEHGRGAKPVQPYQSTRLSRYAPNAKIPIFIGSAGSGSVGASDSASDTPVGAGNVLIEPPRTLGRAP